MTRRGSFLRWAAVTAGVSVACFGSLFARSWQNSAQSNAPVGEVLNKWAAVFIVPLVVVVAVGVVRSARPVGLVRMALVLILAFAAARGLLSPFETGDGVCTHQYATLTGTVRGECFTQPKMAAAILWGLAVAAVALAIPERRPGPRSPIGPGRSSR